jgi:hypothetical protein
MANRYRSSPTLRGPRVRQTSSAIILGMALPEDILDDFVKGRLRYEPGFGGYVGKLEIERVESPSFRSFLYLMRSTMNEELRQEGVNASGGVEHPPFHFDYLHVSDGAENALAFRREGFSFIVVTLPIVESLWRQSFRLSESRRVADALCFGPGPAKPDALHGLLFSTQLAFLVSHEYAHHIHRHCAENQNGASGIWTEFRQGGTRSNIDSQAQELVADGYASYLVLAHLLRGKRRQSALAELGRKDAEGDELLLACFFLGALGFFCILWHEAIDMARVYEQTHPPAPVRIKYTIEVAQMWCRQNGSVSQSWFSPARLQELFHTASEAIAETTATHNWDAQMSFLGTADGDRYDRQLFERFEALRRQPNG